MENLEKLQFIAKRIEGIKGLKNALMKNWEYLQSGECKNIDKWENDSFEFSEYIYLIYFSDIEISSLEFYLMINEIQDNNFILKKNKLKNNFYNQENLIDLNNQESKI